MPPPGGIVHVSRPKPVTFFSPLAAKAYSAAGQAASALHAMDILQVHQAQALKQLHEGRPDKRVMQELRMATDFALRVTKVTARPLGQAGLFGDTVEDFEVLSSSEADGGSNTSCPGVNPPSCPRLLIAKGAPPRPLHLLHLHPHHLRSLQLLSVGVELAAGEGHSPLLRRPLQREQPASRQRGPEMGDLEMGEIVLRRTSTSAPPPPGEGRGLTQHSGPSKDLSEAPGAYGSCSRGDTARLASYETASALAPWPNPEMGMALWHVPGRRYPGMPPSIQPVVRPYVPTGGGLELLAVFLALRRFRRMVHELVRTDNMATVAYINHQGGLRSRCMSQLPRHLLLWSLKWLKSLRAVHIPGELNRAADALSCQLTLPGEWRLHPQVVQLIWSRFGEAQIDLFASPESAYCQLFYSLTEAPLGTDALAHSWPPGTNQVRLSPSEPPCTDPVQDPGGRGAGLVGCAVLVHPDLVRGTHAPRDSPSLEDSPEEGPSFSGDGHHLAPAPRSVEPSRLASGRDAADLSGLPQAVIDTITQARAPSMRQAYALRWGLFADWCSSCHEDPQRCSIGVVLSFLQEKLERRLAILH
ncbi:hypothetical protein M9458_052235 [Cirrhinus mrigala]|uniref:RNase H type-1 domain-containing protein n=1 Tax=Cirrhinus mrigala TaxID=683832 RepID=A0ABD0MTN9_CIRMR